MKKQVQQTRQPSQGEVQPLLNFYNSGQLPQAEASAKALLRTYPDALILHSVLGSALAGQQRFAEAVESFRKVVAINPNSAELHFNLAVVLTSLGKHEEAIASYRKATALNPGFAVAHYNLGTALQAQRKFEEAAASYRKVVAIEPNFFAAHGNLGTVLQEQGQLEEAVASYRKALAINPDARGYFNLATALRNQGQLEEAVANYHKALAIKPDYAEARSNLGEALWDHGKPEEAFVSYQEALAIEPDNAEANYNLGIFLCDSGNLERAIPYFERSQLRDWRERVLYCLYKTEQYDEFKDKLRNLIAVIDASPFLANLSAHYAANFGVEDQYNFCRNPLDFVYHNRIEPLAIENSELLGDLLRDINFAEIAERKQARLHYGIQSSGNLFKRPEASFKALSSLIRREIEAYRQRFSAQDCVFMRAFPAEIEFASSWYVKMQKGGHLTSHIHELGWISGAVYLALPQNKAKGDDASIELSIHGDNYPQRHDNFPRKTIAPRVGDIVMFPSSLFHRTIPFSSNEERICVAFDLKPTV